MLTGVLRSVEPRLRSLACAPSFERPWSDVRTARNGSACHVREGPGVFPGPLRFLNTNLTPKSLIAGYAGAEDDNVTTPQEAAAAAAALALTRDEGSSDTYWCVYDRETQTQYIFTQRQFDSESP